MVDVNDISCCNGTHPLIDCYEVIAAIYTAEHRVAQPWAYEPIDLVGINQSGSVGPGRKQKQAATVDSQPRMNVACTMRIGGTTAPISFAPMPPRTSPSKGPDMLPLDDALHSLAPLWLTVDSPFGASSDVLQGLHCQADVAYVATDDANRCAIHARHLAVEVHDNIASFLRGPTGGAGCARPLLGIDLHCGQLAHQ